MFGVDPLSDYNQVHFKFIYSEKATKFCKTFTLLLTVCTVVKSKVKILQNFVAFSEYMNFKQKLRKCSPSKLENLNIAILLKK